MIFVDQAESIFLRFWIFGREILAKIININIIHMSAHEHSENRVIF